MMKKALTILLSVLLLFTALPLGALSVSAATSGTTGDCTWTLNGTVLTISGNGAMSHYTYSTKAPWGTAVTKVVVEEGVTRIGAYAFYDCTNLTSVTISDSVTTIGDRAFRRCTKLSSLTIPDRVTAIGAYAFYDCDNLTAVTIPDSVTVIGYEAFYGCDALTMVTLGNGIAVVQAGAFERCTSLCSVTLGDSITTIGASAFAYCTALTSVVIPDCVTTIWAGAFRSCSSLSSITLPDNLATLSSNVFTGTAYYENPDNWENDVLYIGNCLIKAKETFSGSYTVKPGTHLIAADAFRECTALTAVALPDSVAVIESSAFYNCESLSSITIPDRVVAIGSSAFYNTAHYANSDNWENDVLYVGNHLIKAKDTLSGTCAVRPDTLTIADRAFYNCAELTEAILPDSIVAIEEEAFSGCKAITAMTLPFVGENADGSGATYLGYLFGATSYVDNDTYVPSSLQSVTISGTAVGAFAFCYCSSLTSVVLSDRVTAIGEFAFKGCSALSAISIPDGVTSIEQGVFWGCSSLTSVTIPNGIASIGKWAFYDCSSLASVTIPNGVTAIEESAFQKCSSLTSVTIPAGITVIEKYAFAKCSSLSVVGLPFSVTAIGQYAFTGCSSLADVYYGGAVKDQRGITVAIGNTPLENATWHCHEHVYDHSCDEDCNECGRVRTDAHVFDSVCDADCNECDFVRADIHVFDSVCDTECNACGFVREVPHAYDNDCDVDCNLCGGVREVPDHRYNGICDTDCNECGTVRFAEPHRYDDVNDLICNQCGFERVSCLIYTVDDLYAFAQQVNSGNTQIDGTLMNDIVVNENVFVDGVFNADGASAFRSWVAMGTEENPYTGTFDGNGYTVYGLYAKTNMENFGFFAHNVGTVQNLRLADVYFYIDGEEDAYDDLGGICARNEAGGILADCSVAGTIYNHSGRYGAPGAAGICAYNAGVITRCYSEATIEASGSRSDPDTAGICAYNRGVIEYCYNLGKVYAHAGTSGDNSIWAQSGGISVTNLGIIRYCFNGGEVIASASGGHEDALATRAGGICAQNSGSIENCFNTGDVSGSASSLAFEDWFCASADVGGIVATNHEAAVIRHCKSIGTVTATVTTYGSDYRATQDDLCPSNAGTMEESGYTADAFANGDVCATLTYHPEQVVVIPPADEATGTATHVCAVCGHSHTDLPPILYGDANGDGAVNARDAALLQQYVAGWDVTLVAASADANGDGAVNARDAALLQQYVAGWDVA